MTAHEIGVFACRRQPIYIYSELQTITDRNNPTYNKMPYIVAMIN